jgi:hypothetical protein
MNAPHYTITLRIPKPHRGWLRFRLRSLFVLVSLVCVLLVVDEQLALPWTESARRRDLFLQVGDFQYLRTLNLSQVIAILGEPTKFDQGQPGFADSYSWVHETGVPPFSNEYSVGFACGPSDRISAGGMSVNGEPYNQ